MSGPIDQIDKAFKKYYTSLGIEYDALFAEYCDENGIDDEGLDDELAQDPNDCLLVDFDPNFPFAKEPKDQAQAIFDLIRKCKENPNITFSVDIPTFDEDFFDVDEKEYEEIKKVYQQQCPVVWNSGMSTDGGFLQILAVERKHKFDYLLHLVDDYSRDRIKHINEPSGWTEKMWSRDHKHFRRLKNFNVTVAKPVKGSSTGKVVMCQVPWNEVAVGAVVSFGKRCTPKLLFSNMMSINDSIEITARFIDASITFISNLAQKEPTICPFQIDMCIAVGKPKSLDHKIKTRSGYVMEDDDDDDDDDDINDKKVNAGDGFVDCIGSIEDKLNKNKLKYKFSQHDLEKQTLVFGDVYQKFVDEHELKGKDGETDYLHRKRLIAFVDRRDKNDEKSNVYMYEPPQDCHEIPYDAVPEWCISASRTCLLPNMDYKPETAIVDAYEKKDDVSKLNNSNIGSSFHAKGALITFSYFVKAKNAIKCYLYWNGQVIRFMPEDIKTVLPRLFNMDYTDPDDNKLNKAYIEDKNGELDQMIKAMKARLVDEEFQAFQQSYL